MALFAGHIVDQKEKLISQMHFGFSVILWSIFFDMAGGRITRYERFYILSTS
jgi:hypothetical protein